MGRRGRPMDGLWCGARQHDSGRLAGPRGDGAASGGRSRRGLHGGRAARSALRRQPGPVMLARSSGCPVIAFYVGLQRARTFQKAWDHFQLPLPFSRAVILMARPIYVPADADREMVERKHAELQRELDRLREIGDAWFTMPEEERRRHRAKFGSSEFTNRPKP